MEDQQTYFDSGDEKHEQSYIALMIHNARRTFRANLPLDIITQLEGRYLVAMGCFAYGITFAIFCAFFVVGYLQNADSTYVSIEQSAGSCNEVGRALTGTFLASADGIWEGSSGFQYHNARYVFKFTDLVVTSDEFRHLIREQFDLKPLITFMSKHDLPSNLIAFTNFVDTVEVKGKAQTMTLAISPSGVFNRNYRSGRVYNINGSSCYADGMLYDGSSTSYAFLFGKKADNDNCVHLTNYIVNYESKVVSNFGIFRLDFNTFAAAMAVNLKLLSIEEFEIVEDKGIIELNGVLLQTTRVHNPRFPKMSPLACVTALNDPGATWSPFCTIEQDDKMYLPTLNHFNKSCNGCSNTHGRASSSYYASDSHHDTHNEQGQQGDHDGNAQARADFARFTAQATSDSELVRDDCNVIDVVANLIYVPVSPLFASYVELLKLVVTFSATELNSIVADSQKNTSKTLFEACPLCTVLSANIYDNSQIIGQYGQTVTDGHCVKHFNTSVFYKLGDTPPQQLVENYFECTNTMTESFFYAIGFAFGNTGTFAPLILLAVVPLLFCLMSCVGFTAPFDQYGEEVTSDATKELIRALLRIQDDKISSLPGDSVLRQLVSELRDVNAEVDLRRENSIQRRAKQKKSSSMYSLGNRSDGGGSDKSTHHFSGRFGESRNSVGTEKELEKDYMLDEENVRSTESFSTEPEMATVVDSNSGKDSILSEEGYDRSVFKHDVYEDRAHDLLPPDFE